MAGYSIEQRFTLQFNRFPRRRNFGVTLAATEGLPKAFVDQPIALTALLAGQQKAAVIGFNGGHGLENLSLLGEKPFGIDVQPGSLPIVAVAENVDHHFSRPKDFVPSAVTALKSLQYYMIGLIGIVSHADRFVIQRVEWPSEALFRFDTMETQ
jgi:hypothetical protein